MKKPRIHFPTSTQQLLERPPRSSSMIPGPQILPGPESTTQMQKRRGYLRFPVTLSIDSGGRAIHGEMLQHNGIPVSPPAGYNIPSVNIAPFGSLSSLT